MVRRTGLPEAVASFIVTALAAEAADEAPRATCAFSHTFPLRASATMGLIAVPAAREADCLLCIARTHRRPDPNFAGITGTGETQCL